jgi:hypothetical protein
MVNQNRLTKDEDENADAIMGFIFILLKMGIMTFIIYIVLQVVSIITP